MIAQFSIYALDALLLSTLIYLFVLMRRLKVFQTHEKDMRKIVDDIVKSTDNARDTMAKLKMSAMETQSSIDDQIGKARLLADDFDRRMNDAKALLNLVGQAENKASQSLKAQYEEAEKSFETDRGNPLNSLNDISDLAKMLRNKLATAR
jgi:biopolymer transport protein ExbB/TolQ